MNKFYLKWDSEILAIHFSARKSRVIWYLNDEFENVLKDNVKIYNQIPYHTHEYVFVNRTDKIAEEDYRGSSGLISRYQPYTELTDEQSIIFKLSR